MQWEGRQGPSDREAGPVLASPTCDLREATKPPSEPSSFLQRAAAVPQGSSQMRRETFLGSDRSDRKTPLQQ